ncbi:hypothetical protein REPUB_Repub01dG0139000 [Reevesia pubescens]
MWMIAFYSLSSGLSKACSKNIEEFMIRKLGIEGNKVSEINLVLFKNYGTSMAGLKVVSYNFGDNEYHSFVHERLTYENLKPDSVLRILRKLDLEDCFERFVSFETLNPTNGSNTSDEEDNFKLRGSNTEILDATNSHCESSLLETPVICKPFEIAFEQDFKIANINPQKTVR